MIVGNDVVDLRDPESREESLHPRWDLRAFTAGERERLGAAACVHRARWTLWAAKESAFKAARKLDAQVSFIPRDFEVGAWVADSLERARLRVHHASRAFDVWVEGTRDWVHAVATLEGATEGPPKRAVEPLDPDGPDAGEGCGWRCPAARVRELARAALASGLALLPSEISIASTDRIPWVRWRECRLPVDLSLSHHGRFVACAFEARRRR